MRNISILVMSSDNYEDAWKPFFTLYDKYFKNDYTTYICTETKDCNYAKTIKTQGSWTKRVRQALEKIDSKYVIFMLEDFFIRNYIDREGIPVRLIASGRDKDYLEDGITHHSEDAKVILNTLPYIIQYWPETKEEIPDMIKEMLLNNKSSFISLRK